MTYICLDQIKATVISFLSFRFTMLNNSVSVLSQQPIQDDYDEIYFQSKQIKKRRLLFPLGIIVVLTTTIMIISIIVFIRTIVLNQRLSSQVHSKKKSRM